MRGMPLPRIIAVSALRTFYSVKIGVMPLRPHTLAAVPFNSQVEIGHGYYALPFDS